MSTLTKAHRQWANRPADETYTSIEAMHAACLRHRSEACAATVDISDLRVEASGDDVRLVGKSGRPALLTNWAFGQLAQRAAAPPSYLHTLPPTLAAQNLNHGLALASRTATGEERKARLLFRQNGDFSLRCALSESYSRIWNSDVTERIGSLMVAQPSWKLPLAYDRFKGTRGTPDANGMVARGAYASDRDMFAFLVDEEHIIKCPGGDGLKRGFFMWNSEVGAASMGITTFLYDYVCGNHYVWGANNVRTMRVRHVGDADTAGWAKIGESVKTFAQRSAAEDERRILTARSHIYGANMDEVTNRVLSHRIPELSKGRVIEAVEIAAKSPRYGSPFSAWGVASGLTELSQEAKNTNDRTALDRAAGKLLEVIF